MAAVSSSAAITAPLSITPISARKLISPPSSSSVSFSYNIPNWAGLAVGRHGRAKRREMSCNSLFGLGVPELVVIAGVAVLVFGPKKLPEVGRSIGKTVKSFQQAAKEFETELRKGDDSSAEASSGKITFVNEEQQQEAN